MSLFANPGVNRVVTHTALQHLAWGASAVFSVVFLLRAGLPAAVVFLVFAGVLLLRFALRPVVLLVAPALGLRRTLILGSVLLAAQFPALALVQGPGLGLALYCAVAALSDVFYWTTYHAAFATLGDSERRGTQIGASLVLNTIAGVLGPLLGGMMLAALGPWAAFGTAAAIELVAIVPLWGLRFAAVPRHAPAGAYEAARAGFFLFCTDGWIICGSAIAWDIVAFRALGARYDAFGGLLALSALAGALGGMALGRFIDQGHGGHAVRLSALGCALSLGLKAACGTDPALVVAAAAAATIVGGLYFPTLMTAFYNAAKAAPCALRFQIAAEAGWDVGGGLACVTSAALIAAAAPLQGVILLALPAVAVQALLLNRRYRAATV
jgi:MFS transporter, DHA1 family, inner membrane transport protein